MTVYLRACHSKPLPVHLVSLTTIDIHIAVAVPWMSHLDRHFLMPAMHATDRIGMDSKGQVLMHTALTPENTGGVWIIALKRTYPLHLSHTPYSVAFLPQFYQSRRPAVRTCARRKAPSTEMMRTGNDARTDAISNPRPIDIV